MEEGVVEGMGVRLEGERAGVCVCVGESEEKGEGGRWGWMCATASGAFQWPSTHSPLCH